MFVRSLRLAGFKSFADPTILEFQPGVNVIVGPNGSGKSNIADALSWVLGSQAPSSLRGASMEDVIFAGSGNRPRLGIADVELTLDNSSRILPLDLAEVTIARSTDRSGASEYRINGAPCRLLDVAELLSDTGIGRSIHTVVGQGQLDAVLQARPEDRRAFIEEAAQIGKFRRRKERSLKKIERVDDNLLRLNDVLAELRRAIRPLKRQASAAAAYSELVAEHRDLKQRVAATEMKRLAATDLRWDPDADAHRTGLLSDELAHVRAVLEDAAAERERATGAAERAASVANSMGRAADRLAALGRLAAERAERFDARLQAETEEAYRARIRILENDKTRWGTATAGLRDEAQRATESVARARATSQEAIEVSARAERALAEARQAETSTAEDLVRAEGSEAAGRATLGAIEARINAAAERRGVAANEVEADAEAIVTSQKELETLETELDGATEKAAAAETRLEAAREHADELRARLATTHARHEALAARVAAFREVIELCVDIPEAVSRVAALLTDAERNSEVGESDERQAKSSLQRADTAIEERWHEVAACDEELRRLDALMSGAADRLSACRRRREAHEIEMATLDEEIARGREALAQAEREIVEERALLPSRRAALERAAEVRHLRDDELVSARAAAATATAELGALELETRTAEERALAAQLRLEEAETGIADAQSALAGIADLRVSLTAARDRARGVSRIAAIAAQRGAVWASEAEGRALGARERAREGDARVTSMRARERELVESLEGLERRRHQAEVHRAEIRTRMQGVSERAMDEWGLSAEQLLALDDLTEAEEPAAVERIEKIERDMRRLGAVNPRAAEEYGELAERETFLVTQIEDLKSSRRDLMRVLREVDDTIVEVFSQAFEDVAREFEYVFQRLFPGGTGKLLLTDPDDVLSGGVEVEARPPGKNVKKLSLLSGGERSLVALAFLFAIFRSRPSPFYLLDEVEAALDDVNLVRFLGLIHELEERAQVLIVTHQKRTMEAGDVLYGVSIAKDGVSRVVAKRMEDISA